MGRRVNILYNQFHITSPTASVHTVTVTVKINVERRKENSFHLHGRSMFTERVTQKLCKQLIENG